MDRRRVEEEMVEDLKNGALSTILQKLERRPTSVVVITFALHAKGREFEPHVDQFFVFFLCFLLIYSMLTLYLLIIMYLHPQYFDGDVFIDSLILLG